VVTKWAVFSSASRMRRVVVRETRVGPSCGQTQRLFCIWLCLICCIRNLLASSCLLTAPLTIRLFFRKSSPGHWNGSYYIGGVAFDSNHGYPGGLIGDFVIIL